MALPRTLVIVLAGGAGSRLEPLTAHRAKPAVRFLGSHRLIDFPLSNARNAGLDDVWVVQQYHPMSLNDHVANGRPWDLDRTVGGMRVLRPFQGDVGEGWHAGTADALWRNRELIEDFGADAVLVVSADAVYRLDYAAVVDAHLAADAEVTMVTARHDGDVSRYGVVEADDDGRITGYAYKPEDPATDVVTTEVFVLAPDLLLRTLGRFAAEHDLADLGDDVLPHLVDRGTAREHRTTGYWQDVGTIAAYWRTNLAFLDEGAPFALDDPRWPIAGRPDRHTGARVTPTGEVSASVLCAGARVSGTVRRSVVGEGAVVEAGAEVMDSVLLDGVVVAAGARVRRAVVDEGARIGADAEVGGPAGDDDEAVGVVGTGCEVPAGDTVAPGARHPEPQEG
ncbi:sugar phosphate nucleotidyltransferase [Georgenia sp. 10Sc9-8]|uniref:Sugar phosphate nucleotidyltransferase n=1 Tax=Georgenia halotolerans TaxID=3028317 RepID=A0ABT5U2C5_9MICO|nr:sugar phosphate nucleotidyltransferase [Georgenia halotolerans]